MTRLSIRHVTTYSFGGGAAHGLQQVRKWPKSGNGQLVHSWDTAIEGGTVELEYDDHHNNRVQLISFERGSEALTITSQGDVEVEQTNGVVGPHRASSPVWLYKRPTAQTKPGTALRALAREAKGETELARLHALMAIVAGHVTYEIGASEPFWTAEDALAAGKGVCQDHAHIFIACAREMGLPARYISGYLMLDSGVNQDAMHAWAEVCLPDLGWVGFDVSNGISPDQRYVRVATGLDYSDAAPVKGIRTGSASEALSVQIEVAEQTQ